MKLHKFIHIQISQSVIIPISKNRNNNLYYLRLQSVYFRAFETVLIVIPIQELFEKYIEFYFNQLHVRSKLSGNTSMTYKTPHSDNHGTKSLSILCY